MKNAKFCFDSTTDSPDELKKSQYGKVSVAVVDI
jgi:hypothetical protein